MDKCSKKALLEELVKSLVFAGHLIILDQEFDKTMQVSIEEQLSWQSQKRSPQKSTIPQFDLREGKFSSAITLLVAKKFAADSLSSMSLQEKKDFFYDHYKVGLETLESIPRPELRKIAVRFARILQDVLATWQCRSVLSRPPFWKRCGFALLGFVTIVGINIFVRFL